MWRRTRLFKFINDEWMCEWVNVETGETAWTPIETENV